MHLQSLKEANDGKNIKLRSFLDSCSFTILKCFIKYRVSIHILTMLQKILCPCENYKNEMVIKTKKEQTAEVSR